MPARAREHTHTRALRGREGSVPHCVPCAKSREPLSLPPTYTHTPLYPAELGRHLPKFGDASRSHPPASQLPPFFHPACTYRRGALIIINGGVLTATSRQDTREHKVGDRLVIIACWWLYYTVGCVFLFFSLSIQSCNIFCLPPSLLQSPSLHLYL